MHDLHYQYVSQLSPEDMRAIMDQYGDDVWQYAYFLTKKPDMADDIAQEVFIKCYLHLDNFRHESSYKTWLYRITINLCKDKLKSWSFRNIIFSDQFPNKSAKYKETPELQLINNESNQMVAEKIYSLPIKYREVIILYYYENLTYNEISDLLKVKISTVKSRLHRARLLLKRKLERGIANES